MDLSYLEVIKLVVQIYFSTSQYESLLSKLDQPVGTWILDFPVWGCKYWLEISKLIPNVF